LNEKAINTNIYNPKRAVKNRTRTLSIHKWTIQKRPLKLKQEGVIKNVYSSKTVFKNWKMGLLTQVCALQNRPLNTERKTSYR